MAERFALVATGVHKRYGDRAALCGIDLTARPGQLHGLLGPNGAGKTTLMRVALGLVRCDAGTVDLLGHRVSSTAGPIPDGVAGFVEAPAFYPYLSGRRNLQLLGRLDGNRKSRNGVAVDYVIGQVGLAAHADAAVSGYSAGMRQRLGLAAALLRRPRLLFLDEPTSSLDPAGARDIRLLARCLADEGAAVVLSSHDMGEVEELCTTLTVINCGRVVFSGTVDQLKTLAPAAVHVLRTSDDSAARDLAALRAGVRTRPAPDAEEGFEMSADTGALDAYVIALGRAGIAVRALERRSRSLESLFLDLTGQADAQDVPLTALHDEARGAEASRVAS